MEMHRLRLTRAMVLDIPTLTNLVGQPLSFRTDGGVVVVSDETMQNELIQTYLARGMLVELDEEGNPLPPPAAPTLVSDAERGVGIPREDRPEGANPEDGTRDRPKVSPLGATMAGVPVAREDRPAGANPEDSTAPRTGGYVTPDGQMRPENPRRANQTTTEDVANQVPDEEKSSRVSDAASSQSSGMSKPSSGVEQLPKNKASKTGQRTPDAVSGMASDTAMTEAQRRSNAEKQAKSTTATSTTSPETRAAGSDPTSAEAKTDPSTTAPSAQDPSAPPRVAADAEEGFKASLDENGQIPQPSGDATPDAGEQLAARRDESTVTTESSPTTASGTSTTQNEDASKGSFGSTRKHKR